MIDESPEHNQQITAHENQIVKANVANAERPMMPRKTCQGAYNCTEPHGAFGLSLPWERRRSPSPRDEELHFKSTRSRA
jgi:hypothetical protein